MRGSRGRGFTLIELLVVVSIIAILSGFVLSAVAQVRAAARAAACASSLRQIAAAAATYGDENQGLVVAASLDAIPPFAFGKTYHYYLLDPFLGHEAETSRRDISRVFWGCSSWNGNPGLAAGMANPNDQYWLCPGLGINASPGKPSLRPNTDWAHAALSSSAWPLSRVARRSARPQFGDCDGDRIYTVGALDLSASSGDGRRHRGRANYAFFDGHVAALDESAAVAAINNP